MSRPAGQRFGQDRGDFEGLNRQILVESDISRGCFMALASPGSSITTMGKSKRPRTKPAAANAAIQPSQQQPTPPPKAELELSDGKVARGRWRALYRRLFPWGRRLVALGKVASALSAVGAFVLLVTAQIRVLPSVVLDPQNSFGTQLAIVNQGHVPVFDLRFSCNFDGTSGAGSLSNIHINLDTPVTLLWPNQTATRSCMVQSTLDNARVVVTLDYWWPVRFWRHRPSFLFTLRKGSSGYFLVPDAE
ncbi:hypothetical protein J2R80_006579 [Bradyrhizobium sp. USDA 4541]|nr:hypothetical protein [Bradyrhizobium sp. USDA 4541]